MVTMPSRHSGNGRAQHERWLEEPFTDAGQAPNFAGAHRAVVGMVITFGLFQHTLIPNHERLLVGREQSRHSLCGLLPQILGER
jgi:hypothetical protein